MTQIPSYILDTNILLRFLMNDHAEHGRQARRLFEKAQNGEVTLEIPFISITETVFTLQMFYEVDRADIGRELLKILSASGVKLTAPPWVADAIEEYRIGHFSFGDACLAAEARSRNIPVASFDRGFDQMKGLVRFEPK